MYVVTFYSYKGGVGRTLALVNVAADLARRGRRVLLVDFDLEAPGISSFGLFQHAHHHVGLVDYVTAFVATGEAPDVRDYVVQGKGKGDDQEAAERMWLMPAGLEDAGYGQRLSAIDWVKLYEEHDGYLMFEDLKAQWRSSFEPDYVFVDSRTGHTDVGGICTRHIPDAVVAMLFPNDQNINGMAGIVREIRAEQLQRPKKQIAVITVLSNVPDIDDEDGVLQSLVERIHTALEVKDTTPTIHHYPSLELLQQQVFTLERRESRLAKEYHALADAIAERNRDDEEGARLLLDRIADAPDPYAVVEGRALQEVLRSTAEIHHESQRVLSGVVGIQMRLHEFDEVVSLYDAIERLGPLQPDDFLGRAVAQMSLGAGVEAMANFDACLGFRDVHKDIVLVVLRSLLSAPGRPETAVLAYPAVASLDAKDRWWLTRNLLRPAWLPTARELLPSVLTEPAEVLGDLSDLHVNAALVLIGTGGFAEAIAVIGDVRNMPSAELPDLFNYAMAEWGSSGVPPRDILDRVTVLAEAEPRTGANFHQCVALAFYLTEREDVARQHLQAARAAAGTLTSAVFSAWRYAEASIPEFLRHLDEMDAYFRGGSQGPRFLPAQEGGGASGL